MTLWEWDQFSHWYLFFFFHSLLSSHPLFDLFYCPWDLGHVLHSIFGTQSHRLPNLNPTKVSKLVDFLFVQELGLFGVFKSWIQKGGDEVDPYFRNQIYWSLIRYLVLLSAPFPLEELPVRKLHLSTKFFFAHLLIPGSWILLIPLSSNIVSIYSKEVSQSVRHKQGSNVVLQQHPIHVAFQETVLLQFLASDLFGLGNWFDTHFVGEPVHIRPGNSRFHRF